MVPAVPEAKGNTAISGGVALVALALRETIDPDGIARQRQTAHLAHPVVGPMTPDHSLAPSILIQAWLAAGNIAPSGEPCGDMRPRGTGPSVRAFEPHCLLGRPELLHQLPPPAGRR